MPLNSLAASTTSIRHRIYAGLVAFLLPSTWFRGRDGSGLADGLDRAGDEGDSLTDAEEGESMMGLELDARTREALERRGSEFGEGERRLSRELEEGFRDDSEDEEEKEDADARRHAWRHHGGGGSSGMVGGGG